MSTPNSRRHNGAKMSVLIGLKRLQKPLPQRTGNVADGSKAEVFPL
jgi:hypothetical protein